MMKDLQDQSTSKRSMGVASHVRGNGGQRHSEANRLGIDQPEAYKSSPSVIAWEVGHASSGDCAKHVGNRSSE